MNIFEILMQMVNEFVATYSHEYEEESTPRWMLLYIENMQRIVISAAFSCPEGQLQPILDLLRDIEAIWSLTAFEGQMLYCPKGHKFIVKGVTMCKNDHDDGRHPIVMGKYTDPDYRGESGQWTGIVALSDCEYVTKPRPVLLEEPHWDLIFPVEEEDQVKEDDNDWTA